MSNIKIRHYAELSLLIWDQKITHITEADAFSIYEKKWRHVDQSRLKNKEALLINRLIKKFGKGIFMPA